jgi:hypothetical protein
MPKWFLPLLRLGFLIGVLTYPLLGAYGLLAPWPLAHQQLANRPTERPILVGVAYQKKTTLDGPYERRIQTYAMFPSSLSSLETVSVTLENGSISVATEPHGLLVPLLMFLASIVGTVWLWSRSRRGLGTAIQ